MVSSNLESYLKRVKEAGMQPDEVNGILQKAGWQQNQISEGIGLVYGAITAENSGPKLALSDFEKIRRILLLVIGLRIILFPIRYFLAPLQLTPDAFSRYAKLPLFGNVGILGAILPLFWIFPFFGIMRREKWSYITSVIFGVLLIYVNIFTLANIVASNLFIILSSVYFVTGSAIIYLSIRSFKYFPKKEEEPRQPVQLDESAVFSIKFITSLVFGVTVILPGIMFPGGLIGTAIKIPTEMISAFVIAFIIACISGWICSENIIETIKNGRQIGVLGVLYGLINGAAAQLPLYGFNWIQIFAMPVGGFIGIILGLFGVYIISRFIRAAIVKKA